MVNFPSNNTVSTICLTVIVLQFFNFVSNLIHYHFIYKHKSNLINMFENIVDAVREWNLHRNSMELSNNEYASAQLLRVEQNRFVINQLELYNHNKLMMEYEKNRHNINVIKFNNYLQEVVECETTKRMKHETNSKCHLYFYDGEKEETETSKVEDTKFVPEMNVGSCDVVNSVNGQFHCNVCETSKVEDTKFIPEKKAGSCGFSSGVNIENGKNELPVEQNQGTICTYCRAPNADCLEDGIRFCTSCKSQKEINDRWHSYDEEITGNEWGTDEIDDEEKQLYNGIYTNVCLDCGFKCNSTYCNWCKHKHVDEEDDYKWDYTPFLQEENQQINESQNSISKLLNNVDIDSHELIKIAQIFDDPMNPSECDFANMTEQEAVEVIKKCSVYMSSLNVNMNDKNVELINVLPKPDRIIADYWRAVCFVAYGKIEFNRVNY
jgi:ribosomal protein L37AE/L43A